MSPEDLDYLERSDDLPAVLTRTGRAARMADAKLGAPRPEFEASLCRDLQARLAASAPRVDRSAAAGAARRDSGLAGAARRDSGLARPRPFSETWAAARGVFAGHGLLAARWVAAGGVASLVVALVLAGQLFPASKTWSANAADASGAVLIRAGTTEPLIAGALLQAGDEVEVSAAGQASLQLGDSYVRMASGSDVRLVSLDRRQIVVEQVNGRVYHRVVVAVGDGYEVKTAALTWQAEGTAFDLDRHATGAGGDEVAALALRDSLAVAGPGIQALLAQGTETTVQLGSGATPVSSTPVEPIDPNVRSDPWLARNAALDEALGLPLGWLAANVSPAPAWSPTGGAAETIMPLGTYAATTAPATPAASPSGSKPPTPQPTVAATPRAATPVPTVAPTSAPPAGSVVDLGPLDALDNIDHALTFSWNPYTGGPFGGYVLVYEPTSSGKSPDYLAGSPNWASAPAAVTSIKVNYIPAGSYQVRLQVLTNIGGLDTLVAETTVIHVRLSAALFSPSPTP